MSTSEKVFHTPELLGSIIDSCECRASVASLARISRQTFCSAIPLLWSSLDNAAIIFALLQGIEISDNRKSGLIVKFPEDLSEISFSRLNLYAPHVKSLKVFECQEPNPTVSNWQPLLSRSETTPLLPNLTDLVIDWSSWPNGQPLLPWMVLFLSPSLNCVEVTLPTYRTDDLSREARWFLNTLAQRCPRLYSLHVYSQECLFDAHPEDSALVGSLEINQDFGSFFHELFGQIKTLGTTDFMIYLIGPNSVAKLPNLERLDINIDREPDSALASVILDAGAFPSLSHLEVRQIDKGNIFLAMWGVSSLLRNLTSLYVELDIVNNCGCGHENISAYEVASAICNQSPLLRNLHLHMESEFVDHTCSQAFKLLDQLPLEHLQIFLRPTSTPFELLLPLSFLHLETFRVEGFNVNISDLPNVALAMPRLKTLSVQLETIDHDPLQVTEPGHTHRIQLIVKKDPINLTKYSDASERVVRFLLSLWPHVELRSLDKRREVYMSWVDSLRRIRLSE